MRAIEARSVTVGTDRFRSMTEARFAVAMSALGVDWRYEPGIMKVGERNGRAVWYCPDFIIPKWTLHVEVKPNWDVAFAEFEKPLLLSMWPLPVLVWSWDEETGMLLDDDHLLTEVRVNRCPACDDIVLVGTPIVPIIESAMFDYWSANNETWPSDDATVQLMNDDPYVWMWDVRVPFDHDCDTTIDGSDSSWNRAMALARGWRPS